MIAHVASAGEERGRVVLRLCACDQPSSLALEAAVRVAQAFESEIESLFVEESQLFELARFPFAREISLSGRNARPLSPAEMEQEIRAIASAMQRRLIEVANRAEVPVRRRVVRASALDALARACEECGPWNVVALAEPLRGSHAPLLRELFSTVAGATGVVLVGPKACRTSGPVLAVIEDVDRIAGMLRASQRLAAVSGGRIELMLLGDSSEQTAHMEAHARLVAAEQADVAFETLVLPQGATAQIAEMVRRHRSGFVLARFGGEVVPAEGDLSALAAVLECPLFLVR